MQISVQVLIKKLYQNTRLGLRFSPALVALRALPIFDLRKERIAEILLIFLLQSLTLIYSTCFKYAFPVSVIMK